ncbi:MAG: O-antigen ligase family protein [Stagnimonas sp.]|nr:O-antigen ligase family protein [Stagnimonas sp.]
MSRAGADPSWRDRLAYGLLLLLVIWLPWPWGSVGALSQGVVLALTGLALLLSLLSRDGGRWPGGRAFRVALVLWLLWLLWLTFSLVPLPQELLATLSPQAAAVHQGVAALGVAPARTLSLEPSASRQYLLASAGLFGLYLLAARTVRDSRRRKLLLGVLAASAGVQAFYGLGMTLSGAEIGFFQRKTYGLGWATGSFVNRNHFAHLLALGAAAALGLLLSQAPERQRLDGWRGGLLRFTGWLMSPAAVWRVLLLVLLSGVVLSQSRMGNVAMTVALVIGVLLWVALYDRAKLLTALVLLGSFLIADLWIVNRYYGLGKVVERLEDTELATEQRSLVLQDLRPLIGPYLLTGSGGGSFQSLFMGAQRDELDGLYDHAHNEYAEFLIEHGVPGLGWLLAMGALHGLHALRLLRQRRRSGARAMALAGLCALMAAGLHASTEFVLHIPALRGWLAVLMGALVATGFRTLRPGSDPETIGHNVDEAKSSSTSQVA